MPRKAPKEIIEHRITLGNYERERINEFIDTYQARSVVKSASDIFGSISLPLLGIAALIYVGFNLDDFIEETKSQWDKYTNKLSDWMVDPDGGGVVNYTSDEIGRAIVRTEEAKAALYEEMLAFYNAAPGNYTSSKGRRYRRDLEALESREQILRKMLNDIATGENASIGWVSNIRRKSEQAEYLQEIYQEYGGTGTIDWEINRDDDRIYDEDGNWIGEDKDTAY